MINLTILLALIAIIASVAVVFPWLRKKHVLQLDQKRQTELYAEKLTDIQADLTSGNIDEQAAQAAKDDLKIQLASELALNHSGHGKGFNPKLLWLLPVVTLVIAFSIYRIQGKPEQMIQFYQAKENTPAFGQKLLSGDQNFTTEELQQFYIGLRHQLSQKPNDAVGWLLLGRVAYSNGELTNAIAAFEHSIKLDGSNISALLSYGQVLVATNDETYLKKAANIYLKVLQQSPQESEALAMAGYVALQLDDMESATQYWRFALKLLPENDSRRLVMARTIPVLAEEFNIDISSSAMPQNHPATADHPVSEQKTQDANANQILVSFQLSDETQARLSEFKYLVVFARPALAGPPAAVVKIDLDKYFPTQVKLSDDNAMMPNFNLSSLTSAHVTVRLSKDADVSKSEGEIEYNSEKLELSNNTALNILL